MIRIGPAGNSASFYEEGFKHTYQAAEWLFKRGLNAFEYSFGRGVNMTAETAEKIAAQMCKFDIQISAHAPYYTNLSSPEDESIKKTYDYVKRTIDAVKTLGGNRVVVHPGSLCKQTRQTAFARAEKSMAGLMEYLDRECAGVDADSGFLVCIETMGKMGQIGTVNEVLQLAAPYKNATVCIDFGHVNCTTQGGLKTKDDYRHVLDLSFEKLGEERAKNIHIHFSKIMYGKSGELKHLTFADNVYGPEFDTLAPLIHEYKMQPVIICESDGTMAEDAMYIKAMLNKKHKL